VSLKQQLIGNNYLIIDNFISPEKADEVYNILKKEVELNKQKFENIHDLYVDSYGVRDFKEGLKLLVNKIDHIKNIVEEDVFPTYSYIRLYKHEAVLQHHKDRPACEISVTVHLGSDGHEWPLGVKKPNGEEVTLVLKPGQAMVYFGCIAEHWREDKYKGNDYGQVFLHYVLAEGKCWEHFFDRFAFTNRQYTV
jgi:soluble cytochrome b562